jgi:hypothetical protein
MSFSDNSQATELNTNYEGISAICINSSYDLEAGTEQTWKVHSRKSRSGAVLTEHVRTSS